MKVLQVVRQFYPSCGGMQQYVFDLCESLLARDYDTDVLTLSYDFNTGEQYQKFETLELNGKSIDIFRVNAIGPRSFFLPLIQGLDLDQYDLIHVHGLDRFLDYFSFHNLLAQRRLHFTTHGGIFHSDKRMWLKKKWFKTLSKLSLSQVESVMACSQQDFETFQNISDKVHLIENGVNLKPFKDFRNKCDYTQILYVGGFLEHKRVDVLLNWFSRMDNSDLKLNLVGDDANRVTIELLVKSLGIQNQVQFLGRLSRQDLISQYKSAGVFVSASSYEGFGLSIVEAMAAGCALILEDNEAFKHFVKDDDTGRLISFDSDVDSIHDFLKIPPDQRQTLSQQCQDNAHQYDWEERVDRIVGLYGG